MSSDTFYLHLLLKVGDQYERIVPSGSMTEADLRKEIVASMKRGAPGFLKTVGLAKPPTPDYSKLPPQVRAQMPPSPPDVTKALRQQLGETYTVEEVDLKEGRVPGNIDVLLVYSPQDYDDKQAFAIDQHLMKGGTVIVMGGRYDLNPQGRQGIQVKKVTTGLEDVLAAYGLRMEDAMVMDTQNEPIPIPVERDLGGLRVREMQYLDYPFFVDVRRSGMAAASPVLAGINSVTVPWASPIVITGGGGEGEEDGEGPERTYVELLTSSDEAWTKSGTDVQPDLRAYPERGFAIGDDQGEKVLAVAVTGTFESAFADEGAPEGVDPSVLEESPDTARLVLVSSASFASDVILQLSQQAQSNLQLAQNLVDWGLEDTDLLSIRSGGTFIRTLDPVEELTKTTLIAVTSGASLLGLLVITVLTAVRRRGMQPIALDDTQKPTPASARPQEVSS
jgi:ABC-2 type transport system permease protein